jgi:hypothetical protein
LNGINDYIDCDTIRIAIKQEDWQGVVAQEQDQEEEEQEQEEEMA